jgi:hypothetical protein
MNDEFIRMWEETIIAYINELSSHSIGGTELFLFASHFICNMYNNNTINKYFDK